MDDGVRKRMVVRVVMLLGRRGASATGEANAHDGQRRSLKIESICALGLEIQIQREISMAAPCARTLPELYIIDRSIECRSLRVADCHPHVARSVPFDREK